MSWLDELTARAPVSAASVAALRREWCSAATLGPRRRVAFLGLRLLQVAAYWAGYTRSNGVRPRPRRGPSS